ncbi:MAG: GyrI-like domain-containing protein [Anaerolineales bacterium]
MEKTDFKKTLKNLYQPGRKDFELVEVPEMQFLMVDGTGNPNTAPAYQEALEALYGVAYKLKFLSKKQLERDYVVPPLEGLWWAEDMGAFTAGAKDDWLWTMIIMAPDWITADLYQQALDVVVAGKEPPIALDKLRLERYAEGLSAQILHIGSYADEAPTLSRLHHEWMPQNGLDFNGKHHEIYLSDPRRVAPEKLKTVLRQPVKKM